MNFNMAELILIKVGASRLIFAPMAVTVVFLICTTDSFIVIALEFGQQEATDDICRFTYASSEFVLVGPNPMPPQKQFPSLVKVISLPSSPNALKVPST